MLNERLIGSQIALFVGTSGILSGLAAVARGGALSDTTALMTGPITILGRPPTVRGSADCSG